MVLVLEISKRCPAPTNTVLLCLVLCYSKMMDSFMHSLKIISFIGYKWVNIYNISDKHEAVT